MASYLFLLFISAAALLLAAAAASELPWPGDQTAVTVDYKNEFPPNLSGLLYEVDKSSGQAFMYGVMNKPPTLYKLYWNNTYWVSYPKDGWSNGKKLFYPASMGVAGSPDCEDFTRGDFSADPDSVYVVSELDNNDKFKSRLSVLRYSTSSSYTSTSLTALNEWVFTADFPNAPINFGFEGITWISDEYLVSNNFYDESKAKPYLPSDYPGHGSGLFFLGLEADGKIYAYALMLNGGVTSSKLVTSIKNFGASVMSLRFDSETSIMWALCDNTCNNPNIANYVINKATGKFEITGLYDRPTGLGNYNNEGITLAPDSTCFNGKKAVFFADDDCDNGYAIRMSSTFCT